MTNKGLTFVGSPDIPTPNGLHSSRDQNTIIDDMKEKMRIIIAEKPQGEHAQRILSNIQERLLMLGVPQEEIDSIKTN